MNGHIGYHRHIFIKIHQPALHSLLSAENKPPGNGQRPVQPGGKNHAAVFLHIQFDIAIVHRNFRRFFQFKTWGIAVGSHHMKAPRHLSRYGKSDDGRIVSVYIILSTQPNIPFLFLLQFFKPRFIKHLP